MPCSSSTVLNMARRGELEEVSISSSSEGREVYASYWDNLRDGPNYSKSAHPSTEGRYPSEGSRGHGVNRSMTPASRYYSVEDYRSYEDGVAASDDLSYETGNIRERYFHGQLADAMKRSIWWSVIGTLVWDITKSYHMIPITRAVFNASLLVCSLFADLVAESTTISNLLSVTTLFRAHIWLIMIPTSYLFIGVYLGWKGAFVLTLIFMIALDGLMEALANTSDLIYKGIDRLGHQYNLVITEETHSKMSNTYQVVFDMSFACLVVPLSLLTYYLRNYTAVSDVFLLSTVMGGAFLILSLYALCNYYCGMKSSLHLRSFLSNEMLELSFNSLVEEICNKLDDIKEGRRLACLQSYLMKRILFLAMETAFEQTIVSVIIPVTGLVAPNIPETDLLTSNLITSLLIAIGKMGGSVYSQYVIYNSGSAARGSPSIGRKPNHVKKCMLLSCLSLLLLPLSLYLSNTFPSLSYSYLAIIALGIFMFFGFSAYPKHIIASSMHVTILSHPLSYKIFDFVGSFITLLDIVVVLTISFFMYKIEGKYSVEGATFSITLFYVLHCLYQLAKGIGSNEVDVATRGMQQTHIRPNAF